MKLKFTDGYNKKNSANQQEIDVEGTCVITNYDTRNKKPSQKGDLTVSVDKKKSTVMTGTVFQEDSKTVNLNENKYSIFTKLASYDGDNSNLTLDDLEEAYKKKDTFKEFIINLGVKEVSIRFDSHAGVMTIEFDKEIIRIDFRTWWERWGLEEDSSKISVNTNEEIPEESAPETPTTSAVEDKTSNENTNEKLMSYESFVDAMAMRESSGKVNKKNKYGYIGLFQIGEQALADLGIYYKKSKNYNNDWKGVFKKNKYGITCLSDFRNSAEKQKMVFADLLRKNWEYIESYDLKKYIGKTINGQQITESGLLAGAHLVGINKLKEYLRSNGKTNPKDGNGVKVSQYISEFANYDMSSILPPEMAYENISYTVVKGDTLSSIAKRYNTTTIKIKEANNLKSDSLQIGQTLIVPEGKPVV